MFYLFFHFLFYIFNRVKPYTQSLSICEVDYVEVDRNNVIESAMKQLPEYFFFSNMEVRFKGEKGESFLFMLKENVFYQLILFVLVTLWLSWSMTFSNNH